MPGLKQIRRRIVSVRNTKQITRAMKLVSAAKLHRAQDQLISVRRFGEHLNAVLAALSESLPADFTHPLLKHRADDEAPDNKEHRAPRRVVAVSGERGLCGAFNTNIAKQIQVDELSSAEGQELTEFVAIGRRAVANLRRLGGRLVAEYEGLPEDPSKWPIAELADSLSTALSSGECSEVVIYYTRFASALTQQVCSEPLLPLDLSTPSPLAGVAGIEGWRTQFEPEPQRIFESLLPIVLNLKLLQAAVESKASEHAARMTAMDSATRNADELIEKLQLFYNRARQNAITRDLIDIVGGAEAQK